MIGAYCSTLLQLNVRCYLLSHHSSMPPFHEPPRTSNSAEFPARNTLAVRYSSTAATNFCTVVEQCSWSSMRPLHCCQVPSRVTPLLLPLLFLTMQRRQLTFALGASLSIIRRIRRSSRTVRNAAGRTHVGREDYSGRLPRDR